MDPTHLLLLRHLENAAAAYGADLPLAVPAAPAQPTAAAPPATATAAAPEPTNRRAPVPAPAPAARPTSSPIVATPPAATPPAAMLPVPAGEAQPDALAALRREALACRRCKLCEGRRSVVFGEGASEPPVMFIGEAPGAVEDQTGRPFVGPAGQLLDRILEGAMGMRRPSVYIANINKCRPPGNRQPEPDEVAACLPFLQQQVALLQPRVMVALGRTAAHNLLGTTAPMRDLRGRDLHYQGIPVVVTWHPAFLLRDPSHKRETWEDIKRVNRLLGLPEVPATG
jgi:DNA polymerase